MSATERDYRVRYRNRQDGPAFTYVHPHGPERIGPCLAAANEMLETKGFTTGSAWLEYRDLPDWRRADE